MKRFPTPWFVSVLLLSACAGKSTPATTTNTGGQGGDGSFFDVLTVPGASWTLRDVMSESETSPELVITVAEVRKVGDADVVRLTSVVRYDGDSEPEEQPEALWAVSPRGLWMLDIDLDDAGIQAVLAEPPHWPSPPVDIAAPVGRYMSVWENAGEKVACLGEVPDLGGEDCPDVCGGGMCVAERGGVVQLDAQWAPDPYSIYEQDGYSRAAAGN